mgnify:CR=1 FL=1
MLQTNDKLKKIKGDASFRSFYRKSLSKKKSIIVFASKEKEKNLLIYDAINSLLIKNKVLAPKLYSENYKKNYIEIEDFGDDSVFSLLKKNKNQKETLYKKSIDLLGVIQKIKQNRSKNFKGKTWAQQVEEIISELPEKVYISFDIDGLDPKLCPNTGTPVAGGFESEEVLYLFEEVVASGKKIIGMDLNEVSPGADEWDANVGSRILFRMCNLLGKSNGFI